MLGRIFKDLQNDDIQSISGLDAAFLYAETPTSPMHVGSVAVIEGDLTFEEFRQRIIDKIHFIPKLRKRLVYVPMSIDYPYWVDDPNFDIDMHLQHVALPKPGSWKELRKLSSMIFSNHLDQNRPLWSFTFVEGLDSIPQVPKGSVAIIAKMHHVAIDGAGGADLLAILFDLSPNPPKPKKKADNFRPKALPNELSMIMKSGLSFAKDPLKFPKLVSEAVLATFKTGALTRSKQVEMPTAPFTAPSTPLNGIISGRRKWNCAILSLDRVKALKKTMGTTMNDVMLAICAGALRRYLNEKKKLPTKPLVANVPISTRAGAENHDTGNQISSMLVQLATNVEGPIERLMVIQENTIRGKTYHGAVGAKTLAKMAEAVPFGVANQAAQMYSRFQMAEMHNPVFNVTITNVPGPQFPLYIEGHKLLAIMGMAPIIDGMGLIITILSYNGLVMISPTSDVKSMPDLDVFSRYLRESANELEAAVLKHGKKKVRKKTPVKKKAASDPLFEKIKKYFKDNPDFLRPNSGVFQFEITGEVPTSWKLDLNKKPPVIRKGKIENPDATFTMKDEHLVKVSEGKLGMQAAFMQGRLKIVGDFDKAMSLGKLLAKIQRETGK